MYFSLVDTDDRSDIFLDAGLRGSTVEICQKSEVATRDEPKHKLEREREHEREPEYEHAPLIASQVGKARSTALLPVQQVFQNG